MNWMDIFKAVADLTKLVGTIDEKIKRLEEDSRNDKKEIADLRREVALLDKQVNREISDLKSRVSALEEGRKTVAAEVKTALTETLAQLEIKRLRQELEEEKSKKRGLPND